MHSDEGMTMEQMAGQLHDIMDTGCGLCQTLAPCNSCIPPGEENCDGT